jgi:hypothetical protein
LTTKDKAMFRDAVPTPWVRYRDTSLYAVPSIHNRLIFAQLVVAACARQRFDAIAVELPASYGDDGALELVRRIAPATGMIVDESATGPSDALFVPVTPADSIVTALRCRELLRNTWPDWHPAVLAIDAEYCARRHSARPSRLMDDYEAWLTGPTAFCARWASCWRAGRDKKIDTWREQVMAALSGSYGLGDSDITQFRVCYTVSLLRGLMPIGQRRTEATISALIDRIAPERRPMVPPGSDPTLQGFIGHE